VDDFLFSLETSWIYDVGRFVFSVILYMLLFAALLFFVNGARYYIRLNREAAERKERLAKSAEKQWIRDQKIEAMRSEEVLRIKQQASHVMETGPYHAMGFVEKQPKEPTVTPVSDAPSSVFEQNLAAFKEEMANPDLTITGRKPGKPEPQWSKPTDPEEIEKIRESLQSGRVFVPSEPFTVSRKDFEDVPGDIRAELYEAQLQGLRKLSKPKKLEGETNVVFADHEPVASFPVEVFDDADAYVEESDLREETYKNAVEKNDD